MENKETLNKELQDINKWIKNEQKGHFWEVVGRMPFWLLDKFTPSFIQNKLDLIFKELAKYVDYGGRYLIKENKILSKLKVETLSDARELPLAISDQAANELKKMRGRFATVQGATTGIGGFTTLAADIPILLGTSLKVLQEMALLYGFDPRDEKERVFIIHCLQFAFAEGGGKRAVLNELESSWGEESMKKTASQLKGWREVFQTYRDHIGWKKLLQTVPIAGILVGAFLNRSMIGQVADTGQMFYKKRRILEKLEL